MSSQKVLTVPSLLYFVTGGQSCWYDANLIIRQSAKEIDVLKNYNVKEKETYVKIRLDTRTFKGTVTLNQVSE